MRDRAGVVTERPIEGLASMGIGQTEPPQRHRRRPRSCRPRYCEQGACERKENASSHPGIKPNRYRACNNPELPWLKARSQARSEEHTSELQSPCNLVCRLLLEKKKHERTSISVSMAVFPTSSTLLTSIS